MAVQARRIALPRAARIGIATAVTGAAFALPLVTTISAQAHTAPAAKPAQTSTWTGATSVDAAPAAAAQPAAEAPAPAAAPAAAPAEESYKVAGGDTLSKIANAKHVEGGWQALYDHNRSVVGTNPNLIFPGQKLALGAKAAAAPAAAEAAKPAAPAKSASQDSVKPAAPAAAPKPVQAAKPAQAPAVKPAPAAAKPAAQTAAPAPAAVASTSGYVSPVANPKLGTAYGVAGSMWASGHHTGADFVASTGTPLRAVAAGTVVKAGNGGAYGNEVEIKLADGKYAQYAHLSSIGVKIGQTVTVGQQIGLSGATGNVTGPHLHFEIRTGSEYGSDIDPIAYLRAHGVSI
ncbi:LysM peptidoglycan-binding domain-containing M23 family metallopeptidase [Streptomyces sp. CB01881]|uniref:M23 family metallopeptidase n=1 Tax=Streptomyces sp. CB01881 TaxID=2078691 RepID=UPI000CDC3199|nr:LysM peptidoglycan-binding domain-containing M23 family metallopeptidase [Streptomyces sp. CB01881]AUY48611.1 peptidase [Streptomyces sp. CB01881]TYC77106.1 LysM peptidoglycan-binding domain-containing protein [Streptomyces sp. CB01881]